MYKLFKLLELLENVETVYSIDVYRSPAGRVRHFSFFIIKKDGEPRFITYDIARTLGFSMRSTSIVDKEGNTASSIVQKLSEQLGINLISWTL